jgi:hypothetical protein
MPAALGPNPMEWEHCPSCPATPPISSAQPLPTYQLIVQNEQNEFKPSTRQYPQLPPKTILSSSLSGGGGRPSLATRIARLSHHMRSTSSLVRLQRCATARPAGNRRCSRPGQSGEASPAQGSDGDLPVEDPAELHFGGLYLGLARAGPLSELPAGRGNSRRERCVRERGVREREPAESTSEV